MDQITGARGRQLPWEGDAAAALVRERLGIFGAPVLELLHRDPLRRATMAMFLSECARAMSATGKLPAPQARAALRHCDTHACF